MSNQPNDPEHQPDADEAVESPDSERDDEGGAGTSTSDLPQGATDGELPPAP
jgi:hypothetical protein